MKIDGCVSFIDSFVPLASLICCVLELPGPSVQAVLRATDKSQTHIYLSDRKLKYAGKVYQIETLDDIPVAFNHVGVPAVMKLERGVLSLCTKLVEDEPTAKTFYNEVNKEDFILSFHGFENDKRLFLMEYLDGTEHGIDIVIFEGHLIAAFIHDKGAPDKENFKLSTKLMPSILNGSQIDQLIEAAFQCCIKIGLENGVFNLDMKMTLSGPKLIEINPRMGGTVLREWIMTSYDVDILKCCMLISVGICPMFRLRNPKCYVAGMLCYPSFHGRQLLDERTKCLMKEYIDNGKIKYLNLYETSEDTLESQSEKPISLISVTGQSHREAVKGLIKTFNELNLCQVDQDLQYYLEQ